MKQESKRKCLEQLRAQLVNERQSFVSHWQDLSKYVMPRRARFFVQDANKGDRRNTSIIDSTATLSSRTLRSGMMSGVTSPARPWFRLTTPDPGLAEVGKVKDWLYVVSQRMATVFIKSNIYNALPVVYGDMGTFGTGALFMEEDFQNVIHFYPLPIGSYCVANDERLKVSVFTRDLQMTVRQIIGQFGIKDPVTGEIKDWSNLSDFVKTCHDQGNLETWVEVRHCIRPNPDYNPKKVLSKFKKFESTYWEAGASSSSTGSYQSDKDREIFLSEKGYDYFPVLCPRWEVTGEDVYGTDCPGMAALGDIRQLQMGEKRIAQAIEKMVNPPMQGPTSLRNQRVSILPGDITFVDVRDNNSGFRPVHEINPRINELENKQAQVRSRIQKAYYEDLFLMLAESDRRQITAREIDERHEEKLLALGPVLEQLNQDLLDPLIDNAFQIMLKQGLIPDPPEEIQGMKLKIDYISVMAQAQKLIGIASIEKFANFVGGVIQQTGDQSIKDKVDLDQMIDTYGDMTSIPPGIVRPDDQVAALRQQRAQAQQAQAQQEQVAQMANSAKTLSQANTGGDNALTRLMQQAQAGNMMPQS